MEKQGDSAGSFVLSEKSHVSLAGGAKPGSSDCLAWICVQDESKVAEPAWRRG